MHLFVSVIVLPASYGGHEPFKRHKRMVKIGKLGEFTTTFQSEYLLDAKSIAQFHRVRRS